MNIRIVQWILGVLLMLFSVTMIPPIGVALYYGDGSMLGFVDALMFTASAGLLIWLPVRRLSRKERQNMRLRDGFLVVASFWIVLGLFGAIPFLLSPEPHMTVTDAVFESISGLTTTGATVLKGLDELPRSILYYRQQLQWLGGMGIIVLAVAVLPMLGVGGMQLYRAETPGPVKETKLTPRITETAKSLWAIYVVLTLACFGGYLFADMEPFDAIGHAFSTVAIGGFSTHDASFAYFDNHLVEIIGVVFMFLAGVNFSLHFTVYRDRNPGHFLKDPEFRAYIGLLTGLAVVVIAYLYLTGEYDTLRDSAAHGLFQAVSIATTTGFTTADYSAWPGAVPVMLLFASFVGGCAGSTGGGMKVIRWLLIYKQGVREVIRLVHPRSEIPVKLGDKAVPPRVVGAVWGFFSVYIVVFAVMMLLLMVTGLDQVTAFSAVAAALNNLGPGLGDVNTGFSTLPDLAKWVSVAAMLLGRLEIFTLLVLFTATFWER